MSRVLRSMLYPLQLVGARLGRRSAPVVLVVLGIAAGASVVFGGRAGTLVAQDRAVAQAVERIPEGNRSVRAVWFGVPAQSNEPQPVLDRRARAALRRAGTGEATSLVLFRETTIGGTFAGLGGVERLADWVTLRSGRLPAIPCAPERCEVLRLRGEGRLPVPAGLRIIEVGVAVLNDRILFGDFLAPTDNALADAEVSPSVARAAGYHRPAGAVSAFKLVLFCVETSLLACSGRARPGRVCSRVGAAVCRRCSAAEGISCASSRRSRSCRGW